MSAIAAVILDAAAGLAVPFIKKILADKLGDGGKLAGEVIDTVAGKLGVPPSDIPTVAESDPTAVQEAIIAAEPVAADLVRRQAAEARGRRTPRRAFPTGTGPAPREPMRNPSRASGVRGWAGRPRRPWTPHRCGRCRRSGL